MTTGTEIIFSSLGLASLFANISLAITLFLKYKQLGQLNKVTASLKQSLEEMDEQAKMIVRTDLQLNKTQEELDKKVGGLYALQKLSQSLNKTLDQNQVFVCINQNLIEEMGFQKCLIYAEDSSHGKIYLKYQTGYPEQEITRIKNTTSAEELYSIIKKKNLTLSSLSAESNFRKTAGSLLGADSFVIAPIVKKEGIIGLILLGASSQEATLTEGDEEIISILASQIGQTLDNAELFEAAYRHHQELEKKVIERTKELNETLNELKILSRRKTDFVSAVSHELRTPLTSIKGYVSILLTEKLGKVPPEVKERLIKINRHSDELTHLVNDMLDIARIESGKFEMKLQSLNLYNIAETALDLLGPQLKDKGASAKITINPRSPGILADKTQIDRVFINLIGNAVKFVPQEMGLIKISALELTDLIQINISDNGIGMNQEDCQRIFEEFYRVDNTINQTVKGTGLGLTLVKNIIREQRRKIWAESKINQGSTFSFTLPSTK